MNPTKPLPEHATIHIPRISYKSSTKKQPQHGTYTGTRQPSARDAKWWHVDQRYKYRAGGLPQFLFIHLQPNNIIECNNYKTLKESEEALSS